MSSVVGIRFKDRGKVYYFDPAGLPLVVGDSVLVETVRGVEMGSLVMGAKDIPEDKLVLPLKQVIRVATPEDIETNETNRQKAKEALEVAKNKILEHRLDMHLVEAEYTFDGSRVVLYFTADGRVDFRELVKDLASTLRTRIELRQIGVRDQAKLIGGIGPCGRTLCCSSFLNDFLPVSIKMAKDQNLSLNPTKISGACGRLLCCLRFECEHYDWVKNSAGAQPEDETILEFPDEETEEKKS